jgi:capsule polysaccharide export protein KpsE/RkpR
MAERNPEEMALVAEHEALKQRTFSLSREHERLRCGRSQRADRAAHHARLRENLIALERHYARLRRHA